MKSALVGALAMVLCGLDGCATHNPYETTTETTTATGAPRKTVVKDLVPAEGQRKIPVTESY